MDNLTHGLCGALTAELWLQWAPPSLRGKRRTLVYVTAILANNLPDSDIALTGLIDGTLGYLLHHRGHTHTLGGALALCGLLWLAVVWLGGRRVSLTRGERFGLAVVAGVGGLLHLLLDFGNNYGVHPFWPLDGRWFFGDAVFIIEPWWWSVPAACLASAAESRVARYALWGVWCLGVALAWVLPLPFASGVYASAVALLALWLMGSRAPQSLRAPRWRISAALALLSVLYAVQIGLRTSALGVLRTELAQRAPSATAKEQIVDWISTPLPATPWCWDILSVGLEPAADSTLPDYVLRIARVSALPSWFTASSCPLSRPSTTAPLRPVSWDATSPGAEPHSAAATTSSVGVHFDGEYRMPAADWARVFKECTAQAFLRYARAPYFDSATRALGDLRFDRDVDLEFAELVLPPAGTPCLSALPNWVPPRTDVMDALIEASH